MAPCSPTEAASQAGSPAMVPGPSSGAASSVLLQGVLFKQREFALSLEGGWRPRHFLLDGSDGGALFYGLVAQRPGSLARGKVELSGLEDSIESFEPLLMAGGGLELWPFVVGGWRLAASSEAERERWLRALEGRHEPACDRIFGTPASATSAAGQFGTPSPPSARTFAAPSPAPPPLPPAPSDVDAHSAALDAAAVRLLELVHAAGQLPAQLCGRGVRLHNAGGAPLVDDVAAGGPRGGAWACLDAQNAPPDGPRRFGALRGLASPTQVLAVGTSGSRASDAVPDSGPFECAAYALDPAHWAALDDRIEGARPLCAVRSAARELPGCLALVSYRSVPFLFARRALAVATGVRELRAGGGAGSAGCGELCGLLAFATSRTPALRLPASPAAAALGGAVSSGAVLGEVVVAGWLLLPLATGGVGLAYAADLDLGGSPPSLVCAEVARAQAACAARLAAVARRNASLRPALARSLPAAGRAWLESELLRLAAADRLQVLTLADGGGSATPGASGGGGARPRGLSLPWGGAPTPALASSFLARASSPAPRPASAHHTADTGGASLPTAVALLALVGACGVLWHAALLAAHPGREAGSGALSASRLALACAPLLLTQLCALALLIRR